MEEFEIGDIVEVFAPDDYDDRHDNNVFNAGWADGEMGEYIGQTGEVVDITSFEGIPAYYVRFNDGEAWWWDPRYMIQRTEKEGAKISAEDFDSILN